MTKLSLSLGVMLACLHTLIQQRRPSLEQKNSSYKKKYNTRAESCVRKASKTVVQNNQGHSDTNDMFGNMGK
jgi:hypothetical protein